MKILVINAGSSSIKYQLFDMQKRQPVASGQLEQIGEPEGRLRHSVVDSQGDMQKTNSQLPIPDHSTGLDLIGKALKESGFLGEDAPLDGIGHRVLHGGEAFKAPTLINDEVMDTIRELIPLGPLHNPANLIGIQEAFRFAPSVPQVAVFDTDFHQTMPDYAYRYAIPHADYENYHIRRYGFHGTSHAYVSQQAAAYLNNPLDETNVIIFHLGNGASVTAVEGGKCVDTSMGLTPLEGLVMGTRCGDIDPAVVFYLARVSGMSIEELDDHLNKKSGLKGICGANDMREVHELAQSGNAQAILARKMTAYRIKKYLGAYYAVLGRVDAVVFTGGIGENDDDMRSMVCDNLDCLGVSLDPTQNEQRGDGIREIQSDTSAIKLLVIPTNEELQIATLTAKCIEKSRNS